MRKVKALLKYAYNKSITKNYMVSDNRKHLEAMYNLGLDNSDYIY